MSAERFDLNPGSPAARDEGCSCPVVDNGHGSGGYKGWVIDPSCPLHGYDND